MPESSVYQGDLAALKARLEQAIARRQFAFYFVVTIGLFAFSYWAQRHSGVWWTGVSLLALGTSSLLAIPTLIYSFRLWPASSESVGDTKPSASHEESHGVMPESYAPYLLFGTLSTAVLWYASYWAQANPGLWWACISFIIAVGAFASTIVLILIAKKAFVISKKVQIENLEIAPDRPVT